MANRQKSVFRRPGILSTIRKKYLDLRISSKIMLIYFIFLLFSTSLSGWLYQKISYDITADKVSELSLQTLYSIKSNIDSMLDNISYNSRMILSNREIQALLRDQETIKDVDAQNTMNNYLTSLIDSMANISSIYLFDNYGNRYGIDKLSIKSFSFDTTKQASWYKDASDKKGMYILRLNAGEERNWNSKKNYVSFIRVVNDMELQNEIGILMINIAESYFVNCYKDIISRDGTSILLLDENNNSIVSHYGESEGHTLDRQLQDLGDKEHYSVIEKIDGKDYILSSLNIDKYGWKILSRIPFKELSEEANNFYIVALLVVLLNGILLFFGAILISRLIANPIKKLLKSMKGIENGEFKKVHIEDRNDEIGRLRDGYNIMVSEIENLITRVINEQKTKRIAELNVLQEQIKPHFLYNTLDAMGYLALSGQNDQLYQSLEALGGYYRTSLSKGSEVITIQEEIEIVKNYLVLQKLRYGDIFTDIYEIDGGVHRYKILKLVLQPLVENALYHGIKPKGGHGTIKVIAKLNGGAITLAVEDDGMGMSEEAIRDIAAHNGLNKKSSSFGLRGTIERLRIFYGISDVYRIESEERFGTRVIITIPAEERHK